MTDPLPDDQRLKDISPKAYEHPADRAATAALKGIPMLDQVVRKLIEYGYERALRQVFMGGSVKLGSDQLPEVWAAHRAALARLDIVELPELYLTQFPGHQRGRDRLRATGSWGASTCAAATRWTRAPKRATPPTSTPSASGRSSATRARASPRRASRSAPPPRRSASGCAPTGTEPLAQRARKLRVRLALPALSVTR